MFQIISRISILAVALLAAGVLAALPAAAEPVPFKAVYTVRFIGTIFGARGDRELTKLADGTWLLKSRAHNFLGTITEQSSFVVGDDDQVIPREYQYHRTGIGPNRSTDIKFDWEKMKLTVDSGDKTWDAPLEPGTQDRLSYQYFLRDQLTAAGIKDGESPTFSYRIADDDGVTEYSFKVVGKERVKTPIGTFDTVKATRTNGNPKRITNFWLAPAYNYLLVRFKQTEPNGRGFLLELRQAEFNGKRVRVTGD